MARSKFNFEKRQKEKARQQKQQEKTARRREAKQQKTEIDPAIQGEEGGAAAVASEPQVLEKETQS